MGIPKNGKNLKGAMQNLADEAPKGKGALIEWLWPEIAEGIRKGHRLKGIWERLCANGLQMKHNEFRTYVSRMKKKIAAPQGSRERETVEGSRPAGDRGQKSLPLSPLADSEARTREHLRRGQGIEWKGTKDEDPDKLF